MSEFDDDLDFSPEAKGSAPDAPKPWPVLVVDDEPSVHDITRLTLSQFTYDSRPLLLVNAYSAAEAREKLEERDDFAVILLDVVMETDDAGLQLARHIRDTLDNQDVRIVLRTGQPGSTPVNDVVTDYGIDDYREKTSLRADQLKAVMTTALASYKRLTTLQSTNTHLQQFTRIASHDLKAPLRQITGFTQLLERELDSGNPNMTRISEAMSFIIAGTRNMAVLLDDLLTIATTGGSEHNDTDFEMTSALNEALENIGQVIHTSGAVINIEPLPKIRGCYRYFVQLFQNLIGNAIKFNNSVAPIVDVRFAKGPIESVLSVIDNGIGISVDQSKYLFEPFYRGEPTLHIEGHGLGLAICKKIAEHHGGRIWAEAVPEGGACFCIALPNKMILHAN